MNQADKIFSFVKKTKKYPSKFFSSKNKNIQKSRMKIWIFAHFYFLKNIFFNGTFWFFHELNPAEPIISFVKKTKKYPSKKFLSKNKNIQKFEMKIWIFACFYFLKKIFFNGTLWFFSRRLLLLTTHTRYIKKISQSEKPHRRCVWLLDHSDLMMIRM